MAEPEARVPDPMSAVERAVTLLMRTNRVDRAAAREILSATARRNGLDEQELAITLVALAGVPRSPRRPL